MYPHTVLLTSIPPISNSPGREEKVRYQKLCIDSWIQTGHRPISLNTYDEYLEVSSVFPEIEYAFAYRSTEDINGRKLVFLHDALLLGLEQAACRIAISNADVLFEPKVQFVEHIAHDVPFAYSNRLDVKSIAQLSSGTPFFGIDYVNMSNDFVASLPESVFVLGLPWWDYWLPIEYLSRGGTPIRLEWGGMPLLRHHTHGDRWNASSLVYLGTHFASLVGQTTELDKSNLLSLTDSWRSFDQTSRGRTTEYGAVFFAMIARHTSQHIFANSVSFDFGGSI
ncbi:MAG: hypothetical protein VKL39_22270 [Leptolyngbyaceae bacterium]|nr:hypothetical protein [Leptolyngbyaceae bacterium]